jgi:hypothetical protein
MLSWSQLAMAILHFHLPRVILSDFAFLPFLDEGGSCYRILNVFLLKTVLATYNTLTVLIVLTYPAYLFHHMCAPNHQIPRPGNENRESQNAIGPVHATSR